MSQLTFEYLLLNPTDQENYFKKIYQKMKIFDFISLSLSFSGFVLNILQDDNYYNQIAYRSVYTFNGQDYLAIYYKDENENEWNFYLRIIILICSLLLNVTLTQRQLNYFIYLKITQNLESKETFTSCGLLLKTIIEIIYNMSITYPYANKNFKLVQQDFLLYYNLNQCYTLFQFGRIYLLWRVWTQYSKWNNVKSTRICNLCNSMGGVYFSMKAEFKNNSAMVVSMYLLISLVILGFAVRIGERSYEYTSGQNYDYAWNPIWLIYITITTVGYGDFAPKSYVARFFVVIACILGPFLISLVNVAILNYAYFSDDQVKAYKTIKLKENLMELKRRAANVIYYSFLYWKFVNKIFVVSMIKKNLNIPEEFQKSIYLFRLIKQDYKIKVGQELYELAPTLDHLTENINVKMKGIVDLVQLEEEIDLKLMLINKKQSHINSLLTQIIMNLNKNLKNIRLNSNCSLDLESFCESKCTQIRNKEVTSRLNFIEFSSKILPEEVQSALLPRKKYKENTLSPISPNKNSNNFQPISPKFLGRTDKRLDTTFDYFNIIQQLHKSKKKKKTEKIEGGSPCSPALKSTTNHYKSAEKYENLENITESEKSEKSLKKESMTSIKEENDAKKNNDNMDNSKHIILKASDDNCSDETESIKHSKCLLSEKKTRSNKRLSQSSKRSRSQRSSIIKQNKMFLIEDEDQINEKDESIRNLISDVFPAFNLKYV